jgi:hypothetical protein
VSDVDVEGSGSCVGCALLFVGIGFAFRIGWEIAAAVMGAS